MEVPIEVTHGLPIFAIMSHWLTENGQPIRRSMIGAISHPRTGEYAETIEDVYQIINETNGMFILENNEVAHLINWRHISEIIAVEVHNLKQEVRMEEIIS